MDIRRKEEKRLLLMGDHHLIHSIAVCLLQAGHTVHICTGDQEKANMMIGAHFSEMSVNNSTKDDYRKQLVITDNELSADGFEYAIILTEEDLAVKKKLIHRLEEIVGKETVIAINFESFDLSEIQIGARYPARIIGLNWTEPAHTTRFLEIIKNEIVPKELADQFLSLAKTWNKDPYTVDNHSIRSRLMSAMVREAFYLVEQGYASIEDIDRACRNDPGYYLPFAGNCRYMDLMGTYAYGVVMKSLNPELSNDQKLPDFFVEIVERGGRGMENEKGLYRYTLEEVELWKKISREFSYKIAMIINRYPFRHPESANPK